jgi:hypothetical protein
LVVVSVSFTTVIVVDGGVVVLFTTAAVVVIVNGCSGICNGPKMNNIRNFNIYLVREKNDDLPIVGCGK